MKGLLSRRDLLFAGALAFAGGAPEQTHHRITPTRGMAQMGGGGSLVLDPDAVERAIALPVETLSGFEPMEFATSFDTGSVSRLPGGRTLREFHLVAEDRALEVAPGIFFPAWTYNGTVPGPTLRCTEGDRVRIHFTNHSRDVEHTVHLHGIHPAAVDGVFELVKPGESFLYEFDAEPYGLQLYHCHTMPVTQHMNRGLYGAFIIDPPTPRPPARELVLVSAGWDLNFDGKNELYALNGPANYYRDHPIPLVAGEPVRLYFVNALEFDPVNSLHIHANFFRSLRRTTTGEEEEYNDIVTLSQADRRILEFTYRDPGLYMFHAHQNTFAERGGMGLFRVS